MTKNQGDRSKLPKWAQNEIEVLEMRLQETKDELDKAIEGDPDNRLVQRIGSEYPAKDYPLAGRQVFAKVGEKDSDYDEISIAMRQNSKGTWYVELMAVSTGLAVKPQSSNVVRIFGDRVY
jgi:hypothetical protein